MRYDTISSGVLPNMCDPVLTFSRSPCLPKHQCQLDLGKPTSGTNLNTCRRGGGGGGETEAGAGGAGRSAGGTWCGAMACSKARSDGGHAQGVLRS